MLPIREGAGASGLRRRLSTLLLRSSGGDCAVLVPVLRVGKSCGDTKPSRTGRSRSLVRVCASAGACWRAISARHGKNTRKAPTRLRRPVAGPDITAENTPTKPTTYRRVPGLRERAPKIVVNGVKTIMVNEPLRAPPSRRFAYAAMLDRAVGTNPPRPSLPGLTRQSIPFVKSAFHEE